MGIIRVIFLYANVNTLRFLKEGYFSIKYCNNNSYHLFAVFARYTLKGDDLPLF